MHPFRSLHCRFSVNILLEQLKYLRSSLPGPVACIGHSLAAYHDEGIRKRIFRHFRLVVLPRWKLLRALCAGKESRAKRKECNRQKRKRQKVFHFHTPKNKLGSPIRVQHGNDGTSLTPRTPTKLFPRLGLSSLCGKILRGVCQFSRTYARQNNRAAPEGDSQASGNF